MNLRAIMPLVVIFGGIGAYSYASSNALPGCSDEDVTRLLRTILVDKFELPKTIEVKDIRTVSGWMFGKSRSCGASIANTDSMAFFGLKPSTTTYTVTKTDDGRLYVEARIVPTL